MVLYTKEYKQALSRGEVAGRNSGSNATRTFNQYGQDTSEPKQTVTIKTIGPQYLSTNNQNAQRQVMINNVNAQREGNQRDTNVSIISPSKVDSNFSFGSFANSGGSTTSGSNSGSSKTYKVSNGQLIVPTFSYDYNSNDNNSLQIHNAVGSTLFNGSPNSNLKPATNADYNLLGGIGGGYSVGGSISPTRTGKGTSMGLTPSMSERDLIDLKFTDTQFKSELIAGGIAYGINTKNSNAYSTDVGNFINQEQTLVDTEKNNLLSNPTMTSSQKQNAFSTFVSGINADIKSYATSKADYYTNLSNNQFATAIGSDVGLKNLGIEQGRIGSIASGWGVTIGQSALSGNTQFGGGEKSSFGIDDISRGLVNTFIPVANDKNYGSATSPMGTQLYDFNSNPQWAGTNFIITGGIGTLGGISEVNALSREIAGEKALSMIKNPTGDMLDIAKAGKAGEGFKVSEGTFFNPNKVWTFDATASGIEYIGTKLAIENELRLNPSFGTGFKIEGIGTTTETLQTLPENMQTAIGNSGFTPIKNEFSIAKVSRDLNPVTDNEYLRRFIDNLPTNNRYLVSGGFTSPEGAVKQLTFISNPRTDSLGVSMFQTDMVGGDLISGTRNTYKMVDNLGLPSVKDPSGLGLYPEGDTFKQIGEYKVFGKKIGENQWVMNNKEFTLSNMKGMSMQTGKTSGVFTMPEVMLSDSKGYIPRITKFDYPEKYSNFNSKSLYVTNPAEITKTTMKIDIGEIDAWNIQREGMGKFKITGTEENMPLLFNVKKTSSPWVIKSEPSLGLGTESTIKPFEFTTKTDKAFETEYPSIVGGTGKDLYSQSLYGSGYGEMGGQFKVNMADMNTVSMSGFNPKELMYNKFSGPRMYQIPKSESYNGGMLMAPSILKINQDYSIKNMFSSPMTNYSMNTSLGMSSNQISGVMSGMSSAQASANSFANPTPQTYATPQIGDYAFLPDMFNFGIPKMRGDGFNFNLEMPELGGNSLGGWTIPKRKTKGRKASFDISPSFTGIALNIRNKGILKVSKTFGVTPNQIRGLPALTKSGKRKSKAYYEMTDL